MRRDASIRVQCRCDACWSFIFLQMASVVVHYFRLLLRGFVVGVVKPTTNHAGQAPSFCCMNVE